MSRDIKWGHPVLPEAPTNLKLWRGWGSLGRPDHQESREYQNPCQFASLAVDDADSRTTPRATAIYWDPPNTVLWEQSRLRRLSTHGGEDHGADGESSAKLTLVNSCRLLIILPIVVPHGYTNPARGAQRLPRT